MHASTPYTYIPVHIFIQLWGSEARIWIYSLNVDGELEGWAESGVVGSWQIQLVWIQTKPSTGLNSDDHIFHHNNTYLTKKRAHNSHISNSCSGSFRIGVRAQCALVK